jgi:peptidoglycan biosynthesis protein MviN/MurJ (putative lipid II flippase)
LFVALPSSLNWYGQLHKDGYVIAGMLIVLWTWITIVQFSNATKVHLWLFVLQIIGFFLIGCARPYALKLLILISIVPIVTVLLKPQLPTDCTQKKREKFGMFCVSIFINWICILFFAHLLSSWGDPSLEVAGGNYAAWVSSAGWLWEKTPWLPVQIDAYFELLAKTRAAFIDFGIAEHAGSMMDINRAPNDIVGMLSYLPRSIQIALFAPFPSSWFKHASLLSSIAPAEMIICYFAIAGIPFLLRGVRWPGVLLTVFFAVAFLAIYGFTTPNLGTLYRVRYAFLMLIVSLGILGWTKLVMGRRKNITHIEKAFPVFVRASTDIADTRSERREVFNSSLFVLGLTFICFFGFFIRDLLLAGRLGLSAELDGFYLALMLPMFAVAILSIPLGNAFIPVYLSSLARGGGLAAVFVSITARQVLLILAVVCVVLLGTTPVILSTLGLAGSASVAFALEPVFYMALLILLLSGALVLGNAILNAHSDFRISSGAQLLVPICSIAPLLVFDDVGANGVMLGMVFGQALNLVVVHHYVRRHGVLLSIQSASHSVERESSELLSQYLPLLASALFVSLVAPASTLLAMQLPAGNVAALNLGTKVVMFITGLLNAALSAVMLPYFSSLIVRNHLFPARRELSYYMLASVFVSIPLTVCLFFWAKPLVSMVFPSADLNPEDLLLITKVMQYGVLQLPFFASNVLLLKFAIATRHVVAIWASAIIGLGVNVIAGIVLMKYMGIAGIALGSSLAMLISTALLLLVLITKEHVALNDAARIGSNWLLFLTLIVCLHFVNPIGIGVCLLGFLLLFVEYVFAIRSAQRNEAGYA